MKRVYIEVNKITSTVMEFDLEDEQFEKLKTRECNPDWIIPDFWESASKSIERVGNTDMDWDLISSEDL